MSDNSIKLDQYASKRLGAAILRRRVEMGFRSARAFGAAIGMDPRTITALESGKRDSVSRNTLAILENALKWDPGYIYALIDAVSPEQDEHEQRVYITTVSATEAEINVARQVAQAAFASTLQSLRENADR